MGKSPSSAKPLILDVEEVDSDFCDICRQVEWRDQWHDQHITVLNHFLHNDPHTVAIEVPVWNDEMSGFIDLLRKVDDKYYICDFKPKSHTEKKAATQLFHYRKMFCERTMIDISDVRCIFFDDDHAYMLT